MTFPCSLGVPGGGTRDCLQTAQHLQAAGAKVTVLPVATHELSRFPRRRMPDEMAGEAQEAELREHGVEVVRVPRSRIHFLLDGLAARQVISRLLDETEVDAVLAWHHEAAFLPGWLRSRGIPLGMIAGAGDYADRWGRGWRHDRWLRNRCLARPMREADIVFPRSHYTGRQLVDEFAVKPERICVVPCGLDPAFAEVGRQPSGQVKRLIYFGWFAPFKGIFDTLEALGRIKADGLTDWRLAVAGWGDDEAVRRAARDHGIADRVELLGRLEPAALREQLARADLAILPSQMESFGMAVAEAQATGLPVVAYAAGAVPEVVVSGETGWLVPVGRKDLLAASVAEALTDPARTIRMGLAGRERVAGRFTWEGTARSMLAALDKILGVGDRDRVTTNVPSSGSDSPT
jgi:glycosyltransferase involved in cell wall biosynthesis